LPPPVSWFVDDQKDESVFILKPKEKQIADTNYDHVNVLS